MAQILNNCGLISAAPYIQKKYDWLESKDDPPTEISYGHSDHNNWIVPGLVLGGRFPGRDGVIYKTDEAVEKNLRNIVGSGVDVFVCLQKEVTPQDGSEGWVDPSFLWAFPSFCNYSFYLKRLYPEKEFTYLHFPIQDNQAPSMDDLYFSVTKITELLSKGHKIFIHCAGGHGRTGVYGSVLIGLLEGCDAEEAMNRNQYRHNRRFRLADGRKKRAWSPSTREQREAVKRFLADVRSRDLKKIKSKTADP